MVDEVLLMQGFFFFSFFFWGGKGSAYHTPPYPTPCDSPDRKYACCNFDHTIAWLDTKKAYFAHIAVSKLWHSITIVPPGRIVSFCVASHVPLRSATPSNQSCFVMMQHTETSFCLMGLVMRLQPDSVHRGY